jgi:hypothetical protein
VEAIWPDAEVYPLAIERGNHPIEDFRIRRVAGFEDVPRRLTNGTLVTIDGGQFCHVDQLHARNIGPENTGGAVTEDGRRNDIYTTGVKPRETATHLDVSGRGSTINGLARESGAEDGPSRRYNPGTMVAYDRAQSNDDPQLYVTDYDGSLLEL